MLDRIRTIGSLILATKIIWLETRVSSNVKLEKYDGLVRFGDNLGAKI